MKQSGSGTPGVSRAIIDALAKQQVDFIIGTDGSLTALADACIVDFVNCRTKEKQTVTLKKGEAFCYGDWNGTECVQRKFEC
jgi:hypothetical protein